MYKVLKPFISIGFNGTVGQIIDVSGNEARVLLEMGAIKVEPKNKSRSVSERNSVANDGVQKNNK